MKKVLNTTMFLFIIAIQIAIQLAVGGTAKAETKQSIEILFLILINLGSLFLVTGRGKNSRAIIQAGQKAVGVYDLDPPRRVVPFPAPLGSSEVEIQEGVESAIPNPVPWLRLGLANIVIMVVIVLYGVKDGLLLSFLRAIVGSILIGTFLGPSFWLSISGGLVSTLAMSLMYRLFFPFFSLVGISIIGAYAHSLTQMALVFFFLIQRKEIFHLLPVILLSSLITGFINGLAATFMVEHLRKVLPAGN